MQDAGFSRDIHSRFGAGILDFIKVNDNYKHIVRFFKFRECSLASADIIGSVSSVGNKKKQEQEAS